MDQPPHQATKSDYVSIKELIAGIKPYIQEIRTFRRFVIFCLIISLAIGIYNRWLTKKIYEAEVSFMINEEQNASSISSALGQFTGLLGVGADINLQKILELSKSRNIAEKVFEGKCTIDEREDFLANHMIHELEKNGKWGNHPFYLPAHPLKGFLFKDFNPQKFNTLENMALKALHNAYMDILTTQVSEKTSIMKLAIQFTHEQLAYELATNLYHEMSNFYIDKMVEKQKETFDDLRHKTDSLRALLEGKVYKLAGIKDSYRSTWLFQEDVPKTILGQEISMLQVVYGETLKNREMASFALDVKTPFIQAIDMPIIPLKVIQQHWAKAILLALIYGFLIGAGYLLIRKFWRDQLN